jgi:signal transduction histidine kinase
MSRRHVIVVFALTAISGGMAIFFEYLRPAAYLQLEYWLRDAIVQHGRMTAPNPDLLFLAIDSDSVTLDPSLDVQDLFSSNPLSASDRRALQLMSGGWPWNREVYALILERLIGAGAKVVVFDCFFAEPASGDDAFRLALDRYRDHVVIGSNFVTSRDTDFTKQMPSRYDLPTTSLIPASATPDERIGFTNFFADQNRVVRSAQFRIAFRERNRSAATYLSLSARAAAKAGHSAAVPGDFAERIIRFTGPPRVGFRPHPIYEIFVPEYWEHNYRGGQVFQNKIVVVGAEGSWQKDELMTPLGVMPGAELHLNALNALLRGDFLKELPPIADIIMVVAATLSAAALCLGVDSPWTRLTIAIAVNASALFGAWLACNRFGLYLPVIGAMMAFDANVGLEFVCDVAFARLEKLRLKSTLQARENLTQMIVHDLRSPLNIVTGYVGALQQFAGEKLAADEVQCVDEALRGAHRMNDMITTLLDVDRMEAGQMPLRLDECDITEIATKAAARFTPVLDQRTLHCDHPTAPVKASCDGDVIRRVLENLINNAIKYTMPDGRIEVTLEGDGDWVTIRVADDGAGIPADKHDQIFEKFGQVDGGGHHRHSSGIGLAFCRMAVEAHGGRIGVESDAGRGSIFFFTLPARVKETATTAAIAT